MKLVFGFFYLFFSFTLTAQITGLVYDDVGPVPGVKIRLSNNSSKTESDFDGSYSLDFPKADKTDILFESNRISVKIIDLSIANLDKLNLGKLVIPQYKLISIEEYEKLSSSDKKNCEPIYHWAQHIGYTLKEYEFENNLSEKNIKFFCGAKEIRITNFEFDKRNKEIIIDSNNLIVCEK